MIRRFKSPEGKQLMYQSYDRLLELWGIDKEELDIETGYGKTHILISGSRTNPPLLLFHGSGNNLAMDWLSNIQELANYFFVVAIDSLGGAGKSEPNETYLKKFSLVLWIDEILNTLKIDKTNIAGVSYGGYMTLAYAAKKPDRVKKIVPMSMYIPVKDLKTPFLYLGALITFLPLIINPTEKNSIKTLQKITGPNFDVFSLNKEILKHWFYLFKYSRIEKNKEVAKFDNEAICLFRQKALFLIGEYDRMIYRPLVIKYLNDNNLNYKIIKNTGHAINHEQPKLVNREIINFLLSTAC